LNPSPERSLARLLISRGAGWGGSQRHCKSQGGFSEKAIALHSETCLLVMALYGCVIAAGWSRNCGSIVKAWSSGGRYFWCRSIGMTPMEPRKIKLGSDAEPRSLPCQERNFESQKPCVDLAHLKLAMYIKSWFHKEHGGLSKVSPSGSHTIVI
jgi:hypothetical protein